MTLVDELKEVVRGEVNAAPKTLEAYSRDASLFVLKPEVIVRPQDTDDLLALVRFVAEERKKGRAISLTPRAAGTDMSGGPLSESIVVDMLPHFNKVLEIGDDHAVVEAGVFFKDFDRETGKRGLELPSYTASREICTVGGMVANDAGGEKNLKYGKTARYVEALDVVLADGAVHTLKRLEGNELKEKLAEDSFEGALHRSVAALIAENRGVIDAARPGVEKNASGYALWDAGDGKSSLNLARLVTGSQGTLGIITKIRFRLVNPKKYAAMTVLFVNNLEDLGTLVPEVLSHEPDSFESYDDNTFTLATKYFPEFAAQMGLNIIRVGFSFLPELWRVITGGVPKLVLLIEFRADSQDEALNKARALAEVIKREGKDLSVSVAKNEREAKKYWLVRRESFNLLRKKVRGKRTAPFIEDFVVPPSSLPEFLPKLNGILREYDFMYTIAGHVGDGNFHIIPLIDPKRPDARQLIQELSDKVYDLVMAYQGSISGEHNDGFVRTPFVEKMFGPEMVKLFKELEATFDPDDVFNPGKKVERGASRAFEHLDLPPQS